jgi:unsaturated chondroitin disaccharide hydrolase
VRARAALALAATLAATAPAAAQGAVVADDLRTRDGRVLELSGSDSVRRALPSRPGALSIDVMLPRGSALVMRLGRGRVVIGRSAARVGTRRTRLPRSGAWRHVELAPRRLEIDGRRIAAAPALRGPLTLRAAAGRPRVAALVVTQAGDAGALLLHRLAELHARVPAGEFPFGEGGDGELHLSDGWTTGFWPGALWRAHDLTRSRLFRRWALAATLRHLGREREPIHDQGFRYLESSVAAYDRLCTSPRSRRCGRLRQSALRAADTLLRLQAGNAAAGTIPTQPARPRCRHCASSDEAETIVDSAMNAGLLVWAWEETGSDRYRDAALTHARGVARLLVRPDGSTAQVVRLRRSDGAVVTYETHQGLAPESTWSRGQAWAVYGFAQTGAGLRDADLVAVSERAARYVASRLPASGVPPWDYDAPPGDPVDTSAGVITAAGLFRLADACTTVAGACSEPDRWRPLAERMLAASLTHVSARPPLGSLDDQVFALGGSSRWDDRGDFIFGTDYALEAVVRSDSR